MELEGDAGLAVGDPPRAGFALDVAGDAGGGPGEAAGRLGHGGGVQGAVPGLEDLEVAGPALDLVGALVEVDDALEAGLVAGFDGLGEVAAEERGEVEAAVGDLDDGGGLEGLDVADAAGDLDAFAQVVGDVLQGDGGRGGPGGEAVEAGDGEEGGGPGQAAGAHGSAVGQGGLERSPEVTASASGGWGRGGPGGGSTGGRRETGGPGTRTLTVACRRRGAVDLLAELSLEHPTLPRAEVEATLEALGAAPDEVVEDGGVLLVSGVDADPVALAGRLGLAHHLVEAWAQADSVGGLVAALEGLDPGDLPSAEGSFAVRVRRMGGAGEAQVGPALARQVGDVFSDRWTVDLDDPDRVVRVLVTSQGVHAGLVRARVDRSAFEGRHVEERPLFSPVSLHPRMARAMVNLARVRPGDRVLDPFVGTGGIALEAGLVGAEVVAGDVDPRMVEGVRHVLEEYGVEPVAVEQADAGEADAWAGPVDAVVTDPPYGRAATTDEEERGDLYERFLEAAREALVPGGRLVAAFPGEGDVERVREALEVEEVHVQEVHGSLTRHVVVARRPG